MHYFRLIRHGDPSITKQSPVLSYEAAHNRVRRIRGKASDLDCVNGNHKAEEWALSKDAKGVILGKPKGLTETPRTYSILPNDYIPMCRKCHWEYDRKNVYDG